MLICDFERNLIYLLISLLKEENSNYDLKIGTKIFADQFIELRQRYAAIVESHYGAEIQNLDFRLPKETASYINNWVKNSTNGYIDNIVTPGK